jgi:hypothetical protein
MWWRLLVDAGAGCSAGADLGRLDEQTVCIPATRP